MIRVLLLCAFVCCGCELRYELQTSNAPAQHPAAPAIAAFTMASMPFESKPAPDDDEVSGKCENCDGTGVVGDGKIEKPCKVCKGTGTKASNSGMTSRAIESIDREPPKPVIAERILTMHSGDACPACIAFARDEAPKFRAAGFKFVELKDQAQHGQPVPWFEVDDRGKKTQWKAGLTVAGYLTWKATQGD